MGERLEATGYHKIKITLACVSHLDGCEGESRPRTPKGLRGALDLLHLLSNNAESWVVLCSWLALHFP